MPTAIDVRDAAPEDRREQLFDALDAADSLEVVADADPWPTLRQYEILSDEALAWDYAEPGPDTWTVRVHKRDEPLSAAVPEFDVRDLPPQRRHAVLLSTFDRLVPDQGFVLVNDHDPRPLYHELRSIHGETVDWEDLQETPAEWRTKITKTAESEARDDGAAATFDVRDIPKPERHPTIHHRYGNLESGEALDVIAPHEPRPLRGEFQERYGDAFDWSVADEDPGRVRVRITKEPDTAAADGDAADLAMTDELDVRDLPPAQRHEQIFAAYEDLAGGEAFELVNDHDPKPLYHQFEAEAGPVFRWTYLQREPGEFRVAIGKAAGVDDADAAVGGPDAPF
ncbi:DUF2249 domain-containing protein [Halobacteriales archaeon Cl-PHB]